MPTSTHQSTAKLDDLSLTAIFILIKFWGLSQYPDIAKLFPDEMISYSGQTVKRLPTPLHLFYSLVQRKSIRGILKVMNELGLSGDLGHILARKKITLDWIHALDYPSSHVQFIFLGGGLDYAPLYTSHQGIPTFSLDSRAMITFKSQLLKDLDLTKPNLHLIKSPPGDSLKKALKNHPHFNSNKISIFVAEGFWDYLAPDRLTTILKEVQDLAQSQQSTHIWSTLFVRDELSAYQRCMYEQSVRSVGEQLLFNYSKQDFLILLENVGFELRELISHSDIEQNLLTTMTPSLNCLPGFYMGHWQLNPVID